MTILKGLCRFGTLYFSVKLILLPNFPPTFPFINNCYYNQTSHIEKLLKCWMFLPTLNWRKNLIWIQRNLLTTFRPNRILQVVGPFGKEKNCKFPWNRRTLNLLRMERRYLQLLLLLLYFCPNLYLYCWCIKRRLWYKML